MKYLIFCFILLNSVFVVAQDNPGGLPVIDGKITYSEVVSCDTTKPVLYSRGKKWFIKSFKSAKDVLQMDDPTNGELIGKGFSEVLYNTGFGGNLPLNLYYTVTVQVKDLKYRYIFSDFYTESKGYTRALSAYSDSKMDVRFLKSVNEQILVIIESLKTSMRTNESTDW